MSDDHATSASTSVISRARLEFLVDGIFAIAMTILVLELKLPEGLADRRSSAELGHALAHHAATFGSYLLSFGMLGILWYRHNVLYRRVRHVTRGMFAFHIAMLAAAAFFPFCAAMLGRYPGNQLPILFYSGCIAAYLWATLGVCTLAVRAGAIATEPDPEGWLRFRNRTLRGCVILTVFFLVYLVRVLAG
jgi:uncharacterized membrane protein